MIRRDRIVICSGCENFIGTLNDERNNIITLCNVRLVDFQRRRGNRPRIIPVEIPDLECGEDIPPPGDGDEERLAPESVFDNVEPPILIEVPPQPMVLEDPFLDQFDPQDDPQEPAVAAIELVAPLEFGGPTDSIVDLFHYSPDFDMDLSDQNVIELIDNAIHSLDDFFTF